MSPHNPLPMFRKEPRWWPVPAFQLWSDMPEIARRLPQYLAVAEQEILFENYIFIAGEWPEQILEILCARAQAGVRVVLRLDAWGSHGFPGAWITRLQAAGAEFQWYHRLTWRAWGRRLRRTHRRLIVVDQRWILVGGFAIADSWLTGSPGAQPYRELCLACSGPVVAQGRALFLRQPLQRVTAAIDPSATPSVAAVRLLAGAPPRSQGVRRRYLAAFRSARESIWIATPYFNPDPRVLSLLYAAVRRGVEVRILLAGRVTDHPLLRLGIQAYYEKLLRHGVRVFEYEGSFLHAKYLLVDGQWASIGSANLDFLSLWFNREVNLELQGLLPTSLVRALFLRECAHAREIVRDRWDRRPWWRRLAERALARIDRGIQARALGTRRF